MPEPTVVVPEPDRWPKLVDRIDSLARRIHSYATPELAPTVKDRAERLPDYSLPDTEVLKICIEAIAFSRQAQSKLVKKIIVDGTLAKVFLGYHSVDAVAALNPVELLESSWKRIKVVRQKQKLTAMVGCAKAIARIRGRHVSVMRFLESCQLPVPLRGETDLTTFWERFHQVRAELKRIEMPYFVHFTSLCHLLQLLGYDCTKPDSAVMNAAVSLGIVPAPLAGDAKFSDNEKLAVVTTVQRYGIHRSLRVPVLDLYLLICGHQTEAASCVTPAFYDSVGPD